ncbi:MAG: zf-HC2 domain-containing protein [Bryobacteraceae bacterium]
MLIPQMASSFTHPSTYELFCYQFGVAEARDRERVEEHLAICGPCREAFEGVERNHPAPESLRLYALDRLYFAQRNVVRLHVTKCPYCSQVVDCYRNTPGQVGEDAPSEEKSVEAPSSDALRAERTGRREKNLQAIDVAGFFELGGALAACLAKGRLPIASYGGSLATVKALLAEVFAGDLQQRMERAAPAASRLLGLIDGIYDRYLANSNAILDEEELREFAGGCAALERGIASDLGCAAVYHLEARGGFDARKLVSGADEVFGESRGRLPIDAVHDINQAGTCLALSLATGAAFHIVRATKNVIKRRIEALGGQAPMGYERNLRGYARALIEMADGGHEYRLAPVMEIRRDPVSDPEVTTTMAEAIVLWATCTDAIQSIIDQPDIAKGVLPKLKKLQQTA